jgi:hypothetical protein
VDGGKTYRKHEREKRIRRSLRIKSSSALCKLFSINFIIALFSLFGWVMEYICRKFVGNKGVMMLVR